MEDQDPNDVSSYSAKLLVEYARSQNVADEVIFKGIEAFRSALVNPLEWIPERVWSKLASNIESAFPNLENALREIGFKLTKE